MKKKILVLFVTSLVLAMLTTPIVLAVPGAEKNNSKFLSLEINKVSGAPTGPPVNIFHPEPPKEAQFQRLILPEGLAYAEIIINDDITYVLGLDFTYETTAIIDFHLNSVPVFCTMRIDQTYVFTSESGISGTLEVLTIGKFWPMGQDGLSSSPDSYGQSIGHGTGDLEGVVLKATGWHTETGIHHEGYVTSWPGLP